MRTEAKIYFDGQDVPGGPLPLLNAAGCGPDVVLMNPPGPKMHQTAVWVTLDATDPRLSMLVILLAKQGVHWLEHRWDHFTERELENAPLLVMGSNREHQIDGGPKVDTTYKTTFACPTCGSGVIKGSPMMIDVDAVPKLKGRRAVMTHDANVLVDEQLADDLEKLELKGLSFRDVNGHRSVSSQKKAGKPIKLPWKRLVAAQSMPPLSPLTTGVTQQFPCVSCKKSGYIGQKATPPRLAYSPSDLRGIDDVMTTWEWFGEPLFNGNGIESVFPYPWFLVSTKVKDAFDKAGVTTFHWSPVRAINRMWMI